jgi:hypothetical protein
VVDPASRLTPGTDGRPPAGRVVEWELQDEDRWAAVEHADRRRRPWRAGVGALVALGAELALVPWPLQAWMVPLICGGAVVVGFAAFGLHRVRGLRRPALGARRWSITTDGGVTLRRDLVEHDLDPSALRRLTVGSDHVFLQLADGEVVTIPCRVLQERGALDRFVLAVERFRRGTLAPPAAPLPDGEAWTVRFEVDATARAELRPLVPRGTAEASFGPSGGWVRGEQGVIRFPWGAVRRLDHDGLGTQLVLADRALRIPLPAFGSMEDYQRFLRDVGRWWVRSQPVASVVQGPGQPPNDPYAPPR